MHSVYIDVNDIYLFEYVYIKVNDNDFERLFLRYHFRGPPILVRILVKFSLGEMGGLLVKSKKSWRNQKYLGEIGSILVKLMDSW